MLVKKLNQVFVTACLTYGTWSQSAENPIPMHQDGIWDLAYSQDGQTLATAGGDGYIKIWNAQTFKLEQSLKENDRKFQIYDVAFLPDNKRVVVSQLAGVPTVWNYKSGVRLTDLNGHTEMVPRIAISADGKYIFTAGSDGKIIAWDANTYVNLKTYFVKSPVGLAPQSEPGVVLITGLNGVQLVNIFKEEIIRDISDSQYFTSAIRSKNNETFIAGISGEKAVPQNIDTSTGAVRYELAGSVGSGFGWNIASTTATKTHGNLLAVAYYKGPTIVWDLATKSIICKTAVDAWQSLSVAFSPLGDQLLVGDTAGSLHFIPLDKPSC